MTEALITRVVIACDAVGEHQRSIKAAAQFAAWLGAALQGVFFEDEALLHLAAMPFERHVASSGERFEGGGEDALLRQFEAHSARIRAALQSCASSHDVSWSFRVVRGPAAAVTHGLRDRDLLVIDAESRPFAGALRLDSRLLNAAIRANQPILILRNPGHRVRAIALQFRSDQASAKRVLGVAATLAEASRRPLFLLSPTQPAERRIAHELFDAVAKELALPEHLDLKSEREMPSGKISASGTLLIAGIEANATEETILETVSQAPESVLLVR